MIGETISHYTIIEKVGEGGMGIVYKARDVNLDRLVAIKVLPGHLSRDAEATKRFIHEARAASALDHPNIGTIYEIDTTDEGLTFIAMAYYEGETLRERIDRSGLSVEETLKICSSIAAGLDKAHRGGIVHRDIKPSNILFSSDGEVKIVDFGLAKLEGRSRLTREGTTLGTAAYMSPEQAQGLETDGRSDIFSLGVILYEMLAGRLPFRGEHEAALLYGIVHEEPEELPEEVSLECSAAGQLISRSLAKEPSERYESAEELKVELDTCLGRSTYTAPSAPARSRRRRLSLIPSAAILVIITSVLIWQQMTKGTDTAVESEDLSWISDAPVRNWILIADFEGPGDDPAVASVVRGRVEASVSRSSIVTPLSWRNMLDGLKKAMLPDTTEISGEVARDLAYRAGAEAYVEGKVDKAFGGYAVHINVYETRTGNILFSIHEISEDDAGMFRALERIGDSLRVNLGENAEELASRKIMPDVKSASMEVFKLYEEAVELHGRLKYPLEMKKLDEALAIDPGFAPAWLSKGFVYTNYRQIENALNAFDEAERRKERLTERQQLFIEIQRAILDNEDEAALELVLKRIKRYNTGYNGLAVIFHNLGRTAEAYEASRTNARQAPFGLSNLVLGNLAELATLLGRYEEADEFIGRIETGNSKHSRRLAWLLAQSRWQEADSLYRVAFLEEYGPFFEMEISKGSIRNAGTSLAEYPGSFLWNLVFNQWHMLWITGKKMDLTVIEDSTGTSLPHLLTLGIRNASEGNTGAAETDLSVIMNAPSYERNLHETDIVLLRAWIEFARGNHEKTVRLLTPHVSGGRMPYLVSTLTIRWLLAESLEDSGQLDKATESYELVLSPLGLSEGNDLEARPAYVSLAHRKLAILYSRLGKMDEARKHLDAFEEMFTDPDPELMPLLETARSAVYGD